MPKVVASIRNPNQCLVPGSACTSPSAVFRNANGKRYDYKAVNYTGNGNFTHTYYFSKNMPKGQYNVRVRSYYRTSAYNYWRMCGKTVWWYIRLK